ncbi:MAG: hypothetical protein V4637_16930 [Pseudomonadota bacterium]
MSMKGAMCLLLMLSGCAGVPQLADRIAEVSDSALESAELVMCRGITVGAWVRAYGSDPAKAAAWRVLCSQKVDATP